jgi:hypothetical protein
VAVPAETAVVVVATVLVAVVPNGAAARPTAPGAAVAGVQRAAGSAGPVSVAAVAQADASVAAVAVRGDVVARGGASAVAVAVRGDAWAAALAGVGPPRAGRRVGRPVAARAEGRRE